MSIYPDRKDGELTGRYRVEVSYNSRRKRGRADSLSQAKALEVSLLAQLKGEEQPEVQVPAKPQVSDAFVCLTMGEGCKRARGHLWSGQATERSSFRKLDRIVSIVGSDTPLDAFDANSLDQLVETLRKEGCSDATVNRYLSNISKFLKWCYKRKLRTAPVPEVDWRDEDEGRIRWISYDEEDTLLSLLPEPHRTVVYVAIRTGMRASEILSLVPDQVSPRWVYLWGDGTKSGKNRSVPITTELYELLAPLVSADALPDYWSLRYEWDTARKAMGLQDDKTFVFHACRHTYACRAVQANVNIRVLQKLMGHATITTTLRYANVDDATLADVALSALDFHAERSQGRTLTSSQGGAEGGAKGGAIPLFKPRHAEPGGAVSNRRPDGGVVTQRTANPANDE
jgi:integrase